MARAPDRVRFWTYVAPDGRPSLHLYATVRGAASAAYWDNFGPRDLSDLPHEAVLQLIAAAGYTVKREDD